LSGVFPETTPVQPGSTVTVAALVNWSPIPKPAAPAVFPVIDAVVEPASVSVPAFAMPSQNPTPWPPR
jgi:hypothetical protein